MRSIAARARSSKKYHNMLRGYLRLWWMFLALICARVKMQKKNNTRDKKIARNEPPSAGRSRIPIGNEGEMSLHPNCTSYRPEMPAAMSGQRQGAVATCKPREKHGGGGDSVGGLGGRVRRRRWASHLI
jgi:hypothetical protein